MRSRTSTPGDGPHDDSRAAFAAWLVAERVAKGMTREHVARVTRIQLRTIERLEDGRFDELPADVFVRGFIRNYARCVGLSVDEALSRYSACGFAAAPVASAQAQALLDAMAPLVPGRAQGLGGERSKTQSVTVLPRPTAPVEIPVVPPELAAVIDAPAIDAPAVVAAPAVVEASASASQQMKKARERDAKGRFVRKGTVSQQMEAVVPPEDLLALASFTDAPTDIEADDDLEVEIIFEAAPVEPEPIGPAPVPAIEAKPPAPTSTIVVPPRPTLVIDDDDPEEAERAREERAKEKDGGWRSFLPPALLDQDRGRQGGLTLAVIILLIAATLTLSYLMRRPSSSGDGVTERATATQQIG